MSNEDIPDKAFFSWLDEHIERAAERANRSAAMHNLDEYSRAATREATLREVRAYFGGAS